MRLSGPAVAIIFLLSSFVFAQHSSSGGSSSGGSSSSSSGGSASSGSSHGSSSGSSGTGSYSSGGHTSSASSDHGSSSGPSRSSHDSGSHSPSGSIAATTAKGERTSPAPSGKNNTSQEKRGFASRIFHPFRKGQPKIAQADLRRPVCKKGTCVCPGGAAVGKHGACAASPVNAARCESGRYWNGGGCVAFSQYRVNDCSALEMMMRVQARRMGAAEDSRQAACSSGDLECGEMTTRSADESGRYKTLQQQYEQCRRRPFGVGNYGYRFGSSAANLFAIN